MNPADLWTFLPYGYLLSVLVETPVLLLCLSRRHPLGRRVFLGFWLTACTYPVVILVLPMLFDPETQRGLYLLVAETFAPAAECALFYAAFGREQPHTRGALARDFAAIVLANLASFGVGELLNFSGGWEWLLG